MKVRSWKWLCGLAAAALFLAMPAQAQEASERVLTLEAAAEMALEHSKDLTDLDHTLENLHRQHEDMVDLSEDMQEMLDGMDEYQALYDKMMNGGLDEVEAAMYQVYKMRYGWAPPQWEDDDMFNRIIKNRDFPHMQLQVAIENTERSREMAKAGLRLQVRSLYDQWLGLNDQISLQQTVVDDLRQRFAEQQLKFRNGSVSRLELDTLEIDVKRQEKTLQQLSRNQDNLEMNLNMLMGFPIDQPLKLTPYEPKEPGAEISTLQVYEQQADSERIEAANARNDYENKLREFKILSQYITDREELDYIQAEKDMETAKYELETVRLDVKMEVHQAYRQVIGKRQEFSAAEKQYALAEKLYSQAKLSADQGVYSATELRDAEIELKQAQIGRDQKKREYALAVHQLELTCTTGPGVSATGGDQ